MKSAGGSNSAEAFAVRLVGFRPMLFDRYSGDNKNSLPLEERMYLGPKTPQGRQVFIPTANLMSFLTAVNTTSAPKRLLDQRKYGATCAALSAFCMVEPDPLIPLTRNGKPIFFGGFEGGLDPKSGICEHLATARLPKGIPNPKQRPMLPLPWELSFTLILVANDEVDSLLLKKLWEQGGLTVGLGTHRPCFGRFKLDMWEPAKV